MNDWQTANLALRRRRDEMNDAKKAEQQQAAMNLQLKAEAERAVRAAIVAAAHADDFVRLFGYSLA